MSKSFLNFIGGLPDLFMKRIPDFMLPRNDVTYDRYLELISYYSGERFDPRENPFITVPGSAPDHEVISVKTDRGFLLETVKYPSRYRTGNPAMSDEFRSHGANLDGYAYLWRRHGTAGRPLVLCLHGYMMDNRLQAQRMFRMKKLLGLGVDVGLYVAPLHGRRMAGDRKRHLLDPHNLPHTIECFGQAVHDLHSLVLLLKKIGYDKIGIIGASLGGYISALYATTEAAVDFMFLVVPAITFYDYLKARPSSFPFKVDEKIIEKTREALDCVSPLACHPRFDPEKMAVVMHGGDRLCEPRFTRELTEKWGIKNVVEVAGGHWLYFDRDARGKAWYGWLREMGFII
jgi:pimeloyl-ACP methyl ester carboxylesterase